VVDIEIRDWMNIHGRRYVMGKGMWETKSVKRIE
jgi:hypothetical protein